MESSTNLRIAAALGDFAVRLNAETDPDAVLAAIVGSAIELLPGISWAGISLVRGRSIESRAPTDAVARKLAELQADYGEGPVLSALHEGRTIAVTDLEKEPRWPRFVAAASAMGVRCTMSFRLFARDEALGVLTLYGPHPDMFSDEIVAIGEIFAQHAAVAMAGAVAEAQMQRAIASRDVIGQAKGILMQRDNLTGLQAFSVLTRASQETNVKLTEVARFLVGEIEDRARQRD